MMRSQVLLQKWVKSFEAAKQKADESGRASTKKRCDDAENMINLCCSCVVN